MFRVLTIVLLGCSFGAIANAQDEEGGRVGIPNDWSHRHQVFSQPEDSQRLREIQSDPRFWLQVNRKTVRSMASPATGRLRANLTGSWPDGGDGGVDWGESMGTASLTYGTGSNYPAKYSFNALNPAPSCTNDYVVVTLPTATATRFNLIAFNNLYVNNAGTGTCPGTTPTAMFAYNASQNAGAMITSPALSLDGKQIAFIENATSAQFHVVKWKSGNVSATFGSPFNPAKMVNCASNGAAAPCEWSVVYSTHTATLSSPYIDYATDTAWVTDDAGLVVSISPVFGGGQPVVKSSVTVAGSTIMTPPVYDSVSKNVFVADKAGKLYFIRTTAGALGACAAGVPPCLGTPSLNISSGKAILDSPIVDSGSGTVFVFSNGAPSGTTASVVQTNTVLSTSKVATIGPSGTQPIHAGAFNDSYFTSPATGQLYVCGTNASNIPQLFAISFTGSVMNAGAPAKGPVALATAASSCSPLTEVLNTSLGQDELFLSVATRCSASIAGGCIKRFNISAAFPTLPTNSVAEAGGTTGIVVDNVSNGVSGNVSQTNVYFVTQSAQSCSKYTSGAAATSGCAVKLTQSALQ